ELISAELANDAVQAHFRMGSRLVDCQMRLWQKSLVLDTWCEGGEATELSFGRVSGITHPRLITVPYITYRDVHIAEDYVNTNPRVLISGNETHPVFTSIWFDWYRSNASE